MVRIKCNSCGETKNINIKSYNRMLSKFKMREGLILGLTKSFESIIFDEDLRKKLSDEELERKFISDYVCKDCKNNKSRIIHKIKSLFISVKSNEQ